MKLRKNAFTLMELMVVILIVGVLAAAIVPIMKGKIDRSKWAEANATAGMIRGTVKVYFVETEKGITGQLNDSEKLTALGIKEGDLAGAYFTAKDYNITAVNSSGIATVQATGSQTNAPKGTKIFMVNGDWVDGESKASGSGDGEK